MVVGSDPVEAGLVPSLAHPNGNITGLSTSSVLLSPKRLELLRDIAPTINTVAAVANTTSANNQQAVADIEAAARALGFKLQLHGITTPEDLAGAFAAIKAEGTGWVIVLVLLGAPRTCIGEPGASATGGTGALTRPARQRTRHNIGADSRIVVVAVAGD